MTGTAHPTTPLEVLLSQVMVGYLEKVSTHLEYKSDIVLLNWCSSIMQNMQLVRQVFVISNKVQSWCLNPSFKN